MTTNWMMILVKKVFTFFSPKSSVCHARLRAGLFIQETAYGGLSYKAKKTRGKYFFFSTRLIVLIFLIRFSLSRKFRHNIRHMLHLFTPPCVFPAKQQCIIRLTLCCMHQRSGDTVWCVRRITGNDTLIAFFN